MKRETVVGTPRRAVSYATITVYRGYDVLLRIPIHQDRVRLLLGSVDISSQSNNREVCTDTSSFVGIGFPNPLVTHQRRLRTAVGRFSKIDVSVSRYEYRPTINSTRMVWRFQPALVNGRGDLAPTITDSFT